MVARCHPNPPYDAAGNMAKRPDPADQDSSTKAHQMTYDAWNRLVKITDSAGSPVTLATYEYDGLGRRIQKTQLPDSTALDFDYYHNESWQVVEVRAEGSANPREQFVYDTNYIDALVMRWYDSDTTTSTGVEEQYYLYDASFSVIALTDDAGDAIERYRYTPYGERIVMDASFVEKSGGTTYGQQRGFQGLLHDEESGLIENRERVLDPLTGRFLQRDPLGYPDGMNAYAAYHVMSSGLDPSGTEVVVEGVDLEVVGRNVVWEDGGWFSKPKMQWVWFHVLVNYRIDIKLIGRNAVTGEWDDADIRAVGSIRRWTRYNKALMEQLLEEDDLNEKGYRCKIFVRCIADCKCGCCGNTWNAEWRPDPTWILGTIVNDPVGGIMCVPDFDWETEAELACGGKALDECKKNTP